MEFQTKWKMSLCMEECPLEIISPLTRNLSPLHNRAEDHLSRPIHQSLISMVK